MTSSRSLAASLVLSGGAGRAKELHRRPHLSRAATLA
jgi:hypothetical protein